MTRLKETDLRAFNLLSFIEALIKYHLENKQKEKEKQKTKVEVRKAEEKQYLENFVFSNLFLNLAGGHIRC